MEPIRVKFVLEGGDDATSQAVDSLVDQITPEWIAFHCRVDALEGAGIDLAAPPSSETRILIFVYLDPAQPPIEAVGRISSWVRTPSMAGQGYHIKAQFEEIAPAHRQRLRDHIEKVESGAEERRAVIRRGGDRFLNEMRSLIEILVAMSEGNRGEFGEHFADLVGVKNSLGRRAEDRELGDAICGGIERLASNLARLVGASAGLRKVRIRKLTGKKSGAVDEGETMVGWEEGPPRQGKSYCVYLDNGGVFRSAVVRQVSGNSLRTVNSLYEIQEV